MTLTIGLVVVVALVVISGWLFWRAFRGFREENHYDHAAQTEVLEQHAEVLEQLDATNERLAEATDRLTQELEMLRIGVRRRA